MQDFFSLRDQVAVVTGGASGIGLETARRFTSAGAKVVVGDIQDAAGATESTGAQFRMCDVAQEEDVQSLFEFAIESHGRLDILVNNAGVHSGYRPLREIEATHLEYCYRVNVLGTAFGLKHAARLMQDGGRIVNTASAAGMIGAVELADYVASKHAVVGLTRSAALELAVRNIRVNCVCPTTVDTPMARGDGGNFMIESEKLLVPLGRICRPQEVAAMIHFLVADDCGFVSGQAILLDGGMSCGASATLIGAMLDAQKGPRA